MAKRGYLIRYLMIIKMLRQHPHSDFNSIRSYIEHQFEVQRFEDDSLYIGLSLRTFQRDIRELKNLLGIDILYSKSQKGYYITESAISNQNLERMIDSYEIYSVLGLSQGMDDIILLDQRRPQGTENMHGMIHAIKNKLQIRFHYHKFYEGASSHRCLEPYALKEFNSRWYIIGLDTRDFRTKVFALDRLSKLEITGEPFHYPVRTNARSLFKHCFGIIGPKNEDDQPEEVVLSFTDPEHFYVRTLPLHASQQIVSESDHELTVKLKIHITYDFRKELLSYGSHVTILAPKYLAEDIRNEHLSCVQ